MSDESTYGDGRTPGARTRVAIACQGGGSHTAFTAGVLKRLLRKGELGRYDIVGLSGTSGGAVCAWLAWSALARDRPEIAGRLLDAFWSDNSARSPYERLVNAWTVWTSSLENFLVMPAVSPYDNPFAAAVTQDFRQLLERHVDHVDVAPNPSQPLLLVGAVDVLSGAFRAFNSRREEISVDMILASAAIPTLFRAVHVGGGTYWDGLFSQNPPIRELIDARPDEIWVIQINPTETESEPRTVLEIADRRNELAGNLSLHQELNFIEKIDQLLEAGLLAADGKYTRIMVRVIELARSRVSRSLGTASKLNREPDFIRDLIALGEARAEEFLGALAFERACLGGDLEAAMRLVDDDAALVSGPPFPEHSRARGADHVRRFLGENLGTGVAIDLTRKQVAGSRVTWTARAHRDAADLLGTVQVEFREGRITSLELGGRAA
jgi:NTE family protein